MVRTIFARLLSLCLLAPLLVVTPAMAESETLTISQVKYDHGNLKTWCAVLTIKTVNAEARFPVCRYQVGEFVFRDRIGAKEVVDGPIDQGERLANYIKDLNEKKLKLSDYTSYLRSSGAPDGVINKLLASSNISIAKINDILARADADFDPNLTDAESSDAIRRIIAARISSAPVGDVEQAKGVAKQAYVITREISRDLSAVVVSDPVSEFIQGLKIEACINKTGGELIDCARQNIDSIRVQLGEKSKRVLDIEKWSVDRYMMLNGSDTSLNIWDIVNNGQGIIIVTDMPPDGMKRIFELGKEISVLDWGLVGGFYVVIILILIILVVLTERITFLRVKARFTPYNPVRKANGSTDDNLDNIRLELVKIVGINDDAAQYKVSDLIRKINGQVALMASGLSMDGSQNLYKICNQIDNKIINIDEIKGVLSSFGTFDANKITSLLDYRNYIFTEFPKFAENLRRLEEIRTAYLGQARGDHNDSAIDKNIVTYLRSRRERLTRLFPAEAATADLHALETKAGSMIEVIENAGKMRSIKGDAELRKWIRQLTETEQALAGLIQDVKPSAKSADPGAQIAAVREIIHSGQAKESELGQLRSSLAATFDWSERHSSDLQSYVQNQWHHAQERLSEFDHLNDRLRHLMAVIGKTADQTSDPVGAAKEEITRLRDQVGRYLGVLRTVTPGGDTDVDGEELCARIQAHLTALQQQAGQIPDLATALDGAQKSIGKLEEDVRSLFVRWLLPGAQEAGAQEAGAQQTDVAELQSLLARALAFGPDLSEVRLNMVGVAMGWRGMQARLDEQGRGMLLDELNIRDTVDQLGKLVMRAEAVGLTLASSEQRAVFYKKVLWPCFVESWGHRILRAGRVLEAYYGDDPQLAELRDTVNAVCALLRWLAVKSDVSITTVQLLVPPPPGVERRAGTSTRFRNLPPVREAARKLIEAGSHGIVVDMAQAGIMSKGDSILPAVCLLDRSEWAF